MTFEAWFTIGTVGLVVASLITGRISVDTAMVGGLTLLFVGDLIWGGILPIDEGIRGFAHKAIMMIGGLYVVAEGLRETGGMEIVASKLLGRPKSIAGAQLRMMAPVSVMSGFMNNTPVVAIYLPIINTWARTLRISPSKLFMPLSFAAILGGKLTLIGTASNIVTMEQFLEFYDERIQLEAVGEATGWLTGLGIDPLTPMQQFWGVAALGLPTGILAIGLILIMSRWLLPERRPAASEVVDARQYQVEMEVARDAPIIGKSIEDAGLRHLPGLYLTQIERGEEMIHAVSPDTRLEAGDRLAFTGVLDSVVDLRKIRGLIPATNQVGKVTPGRKARTLVEAVVARRSPLVRRTVRESQFRTKYNAAIIAVHRNGEQIKAKIGDIELRSGDTLLLDTHAGFVSAYRNSADFYLVSQVEDSRPIRHDRAWVALMILAVLIMLLTLPIPNVTPVHATFICAGLMIGTRCVTGTVARSAINWQVLLVIGSGARDGTCAR